MGEAALLFALHLLGVLLVSRLGKVTLVGQPHFDLLSELVNCMVVVGAGILERG